MVDWFWGDGGACTGAFLFCFFVVRGELRRLGGWRRRVIKKGQYTLCISDCGHCFSAPARAALIKELSLQRHLKSLAWQPVEPMAERAGLCWVGKWY